MLSDSQIAGWRLLAQTASTGSLAQFSKITNKVGVGRQPNLRSPRPGEELARSFSIVGICIIYFEKGGEHAQHQRLAEAARTRVERRYAPILKDGANHRRLVNVIRA